MRFFNILKTNRPRFEQNVSFKELYGQKSNFVFELRQDFIGGLQIEIKFQF
jgi:hypothetical protein